MRQNTFAICDFTVTPSESCMTSVHDRKDMEFILIEV